LVTDPNGNRALSLLTLSDGYRHSCDGKANQTLGDSLSNFLPDLTDAEIEDFIKPVIRMYPLKSDRWC